VTGRLVYTRTYTCTYAPEERSNDTKTKKHNRSDNDDAVRVGVTRELTYRTLLLLPNGRSMHTRTRRHLNTRIRRRENPSGSIFYRTWPRKRNSRTFSRVLTDAILVSADLLILLFFFIFFLE